MRLVVFAKMFPRTVEASFHRGDAGVESFRYFGMAAAFLNQCEKSSILRPQLSQRVPQRVQLLRINRTGRLRNILMLFAEGQENPAQLLPTQLIDAGVTREAEQPRFELGGSLKTIDGSNHLDEHLLRQVFDVITSSGHSINEAGHTVLVTDNELTLSGFVALLSLPHKIGQRSR